METERLIIDRDKARELYRAYRTHAHYSSPVDHEIQRTYQLIAQGRVVIRALDSIHAAGLNEEGLPKLAIVRADAEKCWLTSGRDEAIFAGDDAFSRRSNEHWSRRLAVPWPGFTTTRYRYQALTPLIPVHLRPKRGLASYHILFEAEWSRKIPIDPLLLRRVGSQGDVWLVVAAWDLTAIEQAVLAGRLGS